MKYFYLIISAILIATTPAVAQFSVEQTPAQESVALFSDRVKSTSTNVEYFNLAKYRAERAAIRKERNFLEYGAGLQGTLTSYNDSWIATSGGDNSIAMIATAFVHHTFTKNLFFIESRVDAKIGYNRMKVESNGGQDGIWFKNQDEFAISTAPSFKISKNWSYGSIIKFRSQFVDGYISRTQQEQTSRKSTFMAPGYLDVSLGINFTSPKPKWPFMVNLSPIALSAVFVESDLVRTNVWDKKAGWQVYGLASPNHTSKYEGGSSIQINYDRTFGKRGVIRYRTTLFTFFGWITNISTKNKISGFDAYQDAYAKWDAGVKDPHDKPVLALHPAVRWENTIEIKATKFLSTTLNFQMYYNRAQNYDVQLQTLLSVGIAYTFKNK